MLSVRGAVVQFRDVTALDGVDLDVLDGSVVCVLGPSGCGKSTLLRAIAGLVDLDRGTVAWNGADIAGMPVHRRRFGLMFQDGALFPHRNVLDNVAFGLRMDGVPTASRGVRAREVLDLVGLAGFEDRAVSELSGGEQQRVALARALAPSPRLLMLDEPLGALDRGLRDRLVAELRELFSALAVTAVYVTHDQDEALALADDVVLMGHGRVLQAGPPSVVWNDPAREDVARFVGYTNVLDATIARTADGSATVEGGWGSLPLACDSGIEVGEAVRVAIRPEAFRLVDDSDTGAELTGGLEATVSECRFRPTGWHVRAAAGGVHLECLLSSSDPGSVIAAGNGPSLRAADESGPRAHRAAPAPGSRIRLGVAPGAVRVFPQDGDADRSRSNASELMQ